MIEKYGTKIVIGILSGIVAILAQNHQDKVIEQSVEKSVEKMNSDEDNDDE